jgi:hypothetical protein
MSKNKSPDPSDAEDYLSRLQWKSENGYRRHLPWYLIPKWKYKPISRVELPNSTFSTFLIFGMFMFLIGYLIYSSIVDHSGLSTFVLIVVSIVAIILFFATRDAQNNFEDDD